MRSIGTGHGEEARRLTVISLLSGDDMEAVAQGNVFCDGAALQGEPWAFVHVSDRRLDTDSAVDISA